MRFLRIVIRPAAWLLVLLLALTLAAGATEGPTAGAGSGTSSATNIVASLITTAGAQFVDTLVAGCAVDYRLSWQVLP